MCTSRTPGTLTARAAGAYAGEENHLLTTPEIPSHNHTLTDPGHTHTIGSTLTFTGILNIQGGASANINIVGQSISSSTTGITLAAAGGGGAHNNMQPHVAMWVKVKL